MLWGHKARLCQLSQKLDSAGLSTNALPWQRRHQQPTLANAGAWVMFDGTPYAYLHICGTPWAGNEYTPDQVPVWTMRYSPPTEPPANIPRR